MMSTNVQPSSRQCDNAEIVAGNGNMKKGRAAMDGVSIPMFTAKGMAVTRGNGEKVSPYYFAYEDLLEDWELMVEAAAKTGEIVPAKPTVSFIEGEAHLCERLLILILCYGLGCGT
jgi:hypothetical protein